MAADRAGRQQRAQVAGPPVVPERQFGAWTMGFQTGKEALADEPAFRNLMGREVPPEL